MIPSHDKANENWPVQPLPPGTYINDAAQLAVSMDIRAALHRSNSLLQDLLFYVVRATESKKKRAPLKILARQATRPKSRKRRKK